MKVELKRLGKKPFFTVTDGDGERLGLVDFEGREKIFPSDGSEPDGETVRETVAESEKRIARSHSYYLLSRRDYSSLALKKKLTELPLGEEAADLAVSRLRDMGYVRDDDYAERIASQYAARGYGPIRIGVELKLREFDAETSKAALAAVSEEFDFAESARDAAEKKYGDLSALTREEREKTSAFLARRGFTYGQIATALE